MNKSKNPRHDDLSPSVPTRQGGWILLAAAWLTVSLPLAWGIYKTLEKAALLFRSG